MSQIKSTKILYDYGDAKLEQEINNEDLQKINDVMLADAFLPGKNADFIFTHIKEDDEPTIMEEKMLYWLLKKAIRIGRIKEREENSPIQFTDEQLHWIINGHPEQEELNPVFSRLFKSAYEQGKKDALAGIKKDLAPNKIKNKDYYYIFFALVIIALIIIISSLVHDLITTNTIHLL